jgi:HEAT repeat protein
MAAVVAAVLVGPAGLEAADVTALVESMPKADRETDGKYTGPSPETAEQAVRQILDGGVESVLKLVGMLDAADDGSDYKAHYLLHATATYSAETGRERHRKTVVAALLRGLAADAPTAVKARLLEELKWVGRAESVGPVGRFLADETLGAQAADVLVAVGTDSAAEAMRDALPRAEGRNRLHLIQGLGRLGDREAVPVLMRSLEASKRAERIAAAVALAQIADPSAAVAVLKAADTDDVRQRRLITHAALEMAANLTDRPDVAARMYQGLWKTRDDPEERHIRIAALWGLADVQGEEAMDHVAVAMGSEDLEIRAAAREIALSTAGEQVTQWWVDRIEGAEPAARAGILAMLSSRGDPAAQPAVRRALGDPSPKVRLAAIEAAGVLGDAATVSPLVARLEEATSGEERQAVRDALARLEDAATDGAVAQHVTEQVKAGTRAVLLDVLAARGARDQVAVVVRQVRSDDAEVRAAAVRALGALGGEGQIPLLVRQLMEAEQGEAGRAAESALMEVGPRAPEAAVRAIARAIRGAKPEVAGALLRILDEIGGPQALAVVAPYARHKDAGLRDAAVRALVGWPGSEAAEALLEVARTTENKAHRVLAIRRYVEIGRREVRDHERKLDMFRKAADAAKDADTKRRVLAAVGGVKSLPALKLAASYLDDREVAEEAAAAVVSIARDQRMRGNLDRRDVRGALEKVLKVAKNQRTRDDATRLLAVRAPGDPGKGN